MFFSLYLVKIALLNVFHWSTHKRRGTNHIREKGMGVGGKSETGENYAGRIVTIHYQESKRVDF